MEVKVVNFTSLKRIILIWNRYIAYVPHSYRLWSTLWQRILFPSSSLFPGVITLVCFTLLEWGVHLNGIFLLEKDILCSSFTMKFFPARKHVWQIGVGMFMTSIKWLKVLEMSPTHDETSWSFFKISTPQTQHEPLNASAWNSSHIFV